MTIYKGFYPHLGTSQWFISILSHFTQSSPQTRPQHQLARRMANPFEPASPVQQAPPAHHTALSDSETHPSPALGLAVQQLREFLRTLEGGVVQQRAFVNRTVTYLLSRLAGKKPVGRTLVCTFRNHRHGGYRFVTGASQPQMERVGLWVQMVSTFHKFRILPHMSLLMCIFKVPRHSDKCSLPLS
jgi:hypothetical protein